MRVSAVVNAANFTDCIQKLYEGSFSGVWKRKGHRKTSKYFSFQFQLLEVGDDCNGNMCATRKVDSKPVFPP